jgi:hypothetical protein
MAGGVELLFDHPCRVVDVARLAGDGRQSAQRQLDLGMAVGALVAARAERGEQVVGERSGNGQEALRSGLGVVGHRRFDQVARAVLLVAERQVGVAGREAVDAVVGVQVAVGALHGLDQVDGLRSQVAPTGHAGGLDPLVQVGVGEVHRSTIGRDSPHQSPEVVEHSLLLEPIEHDNERVVAELCLPAAPEVVRQHDVWVIVHGGMLARASEGDRGQPPVVSAADRAARTKASLRGSPLGSNLRSFIT